MKKIRVLTSYVYVKTTENPTSRCVCCLHTELPRDKMIRNRKGHAQRFSHTPARWTSTEQPLGSESSTTGRDIGSVTGRRTNGNCIETCCLSTPRYHANMDWTCIMLRIVIQAIRITRRTHGKETFKTHTC